MEHRIAKVIAAAIALSGLEASAQAVAPPPAEPSAAPQAAPPVALPSGPGQPPLPACPELRRPEDLVLLADAMAQANRRARDVSRYYAAFDREGGEFSPEKHEQYRNRRAGGAILIVLGGSSIFAAMVSGITLGLNSLSDEDDYDQPTEGYEEDSRDRLLPALPLGLLFGGIGAIAIGVPLTISGAAGKRRQDLLRRKLEILAPYGAPDAYVSLFTDPERGAGGLQLQLTF
jgi:hypothetical protein